MHKKHFLLVFAALFLSISMFAQLEVRKDSFKKLDCFVNENKEKQTDDNDRPYAVLIVKTENIDSQQCRELNFMGDARTFVEIEYKGDDLWLYISYYATYIKISHDDFSSTEFWFPFDMEPKCGYELKLVNKTLPISNGWAILTIETKPENGAVILLNGRTINETTPYTNNMIPSGTYDITVSKEGFVDVTTTIELQEGEDKTVEIEMQLTSGYLTVESEPIGATVYIDGDDYGKTPIEINHIVRGSHELRLEKSGYATVNKKIVIDNQKMIVNENLFIGRYVSVSTDCDGDKIFVDGNYIGISPITYSLRIGEHEVTAIHGYYGYNTDIDAIKRINGIKFVTEKIVVSYVGTLSIVLSYFENKTFEVNGEKFEMVAVQGGTFSMGGKKPLDVYPDVEPQHSVTVSDYYIGKFLVTQKLWKAVMGNKPSKWKGNDLPVEQVSWNDAMEFIRKLNQITGRKFRLPTEAEWEYAARGGNKSKGYNYSGSDFWRKVMWYCDNSDNKTHPVGQKLPNELGIYDMSGNVYELCQDWYCEYSSNHQTNPIGPTKGKKRVIRGGAWYSSHEWCAVVSRAQVDPNDKKEYIGFRIVLDK